MICDLETTSVCMHNTQTTNSHVIHCDLLLYTFNSIRPAELPVPTFTTVSDCNLPWQLLSSKTFRLRRVDPLLTNVRGSGIPGSRNQCHKFGLGGNVDKLGGFWGVLKTPILGSKRGSKKGSKRGSKKGQKTPLFGTPKSGK